MHLTIKANIKVYPPQEDSWFLLDVLTEVLTSPEYEKRTQVVLCELGIGTGYISLNLAQRFPNTRTIGIDISFEAAQFAHENLNRCLPRTHFEIICTNILDPFVFENFSPDIIFFNPPYLLTSLTEFQRQGPLIRSWAGGPGGITVIQQFLAGLSQFTFGRAFFLTSSLNENREIEAQFENQFRLNRIASRIAGNEELICYEVTIKDIQLSEFIEKVY
ncbi:MAG: methyltransferase [Candidatus Thorarchaeota archaeon]